MGILHQKPGHHPFMGFAILFGTIFVVAQVGWVILQVLWFVGKGAIELTGAILKYAIWRIQGGKLQPAIPDETEVGSIAPSQEHQIDYLDAAVSFDKLYNPLNLASYLVTVEEEVPSMGLRVGDKLVVDTSKIPVEGDLTVVDGRLRRFIKKEDELACLVNGVVTNSFTNSNQ